MDIEDIENLGYSDENERLIIDPVIPKVKRKNFDNSQITFVNEELFFENYSDFDENEQKENNKNNFNINQLNGKKLINKKNYRKQNPKFKKINEINDQCTIKNNLNENLNLKEFSNVPGQAVIFLKTWGCAHNNSDSEYMAGQLNSFGYIITDNEDIADLWLLNSCTVKTPSEQHFKNYIEKGLKLEKKIVVAGCVSQSTPNTKYLKDISIVGVQQIDRVLEVVEETLKGNTVRLLNVRTQNSNNKDSKKLTSLNMPKIRKNELIEIISISVGCLNECTYCKTKHARGDLASYTIEEITERAKSSIEEGVKEIWLTSEDSGAYGKDLENKMLKEGKKIDVKPNIVNLLKSILNIMPKDCRLRLGMTNPPYILEHLPEITQLMLEDERLYKFLHIPVQSGSNDVLNDMKREYTVEEFQYIIDYMKKKIPNILIVTDVICGYPTETEYDFKRTFDLVDKNKFTSLFINQFYPRRGTPAALLQFIPSNIMRKRTRDLSKLFQSYFPYENNVGKKYKILVTQSSTDNNYFVGHNEFYEQILVPKNELYFGKLIEVKIISTDKFHMMGVPVEQLSSYLFKNLLKNNTFLISILSLAILICGIIIFHLKFSLNKLI